ncbi:MAG TPA: glycosyltransferase family 9 protein [Candidatus Binatia bacterium]|nr:glycosyltransferase family 9 protein [Candidatus Binatia bacterium]
MSQPAAPGTRVALLVAGGQVETLQASPLIRTLHAGIPGASITVACSPDAESLARALEGADATLGLPALDGGRSPLRWLSAWASLRRLRFDIAVICSTAPSVRLLTYLAGIPRRLGPGGGVTTILLSDRVAERRHDNRAANWLRLAHPLGIASERHHPRLEPGPEADQRALVQLHSSGIADGRLLVALVPGTGHCDVSGVAPEETAWTPERWAHLANQLAARHGVGIVFVGTAEDEAAVAAAAVDVEAPHADITGQLDLLALAALLHHCDLLVSGDSPLLHLAAAVGTPTIGLFGPTDGRRRGPYGEEHRIVQALPGEHRRGDGADGLMEQIRVEDVLAGIEASL